MKKSLAHVAGLTLAFLLLLMLSGNLSGAASEILYYAAYVLPISVFFIFVRRESGEVLSIRITRKDALLCLPAIAPTVAVTLGISALTSMLLSLFGESGSQVLKGELWELLILHALLPAVLEEALFRYAFLSILAPRSRKTAVLVSALLFSLAHCSLAKIPYAFFAGVVFAVLDLATGSILPSLVLHTVNNAVSVFWQWEMSTDAFRIPFAVALLILTAVSVLSVAIFRTRYAKMTSFLIDKNDKATTTWQIWMLAALCLVIAAGSFFEV